MTPYACGDYVCPTRTQAEIDCPPCDFTANNPRGCGIVPTGCNQTVCDKDIKMACNDPTKPWKTVTINQTYHSVIESVNQLGAPRSSFFVFYPPLDQCKGYKITYHTIQGKLSVSASYVPHDILIPSTLKSRQNTSPYEKKQITFCPNNNYKNELNTNTPPKFPYGTIFFTANSLDDNYAIFDVIVEPIDVEPPKPNATCTQVDKDIPCVVDGQMFVTNKTLQVPGGSNGYLLVSFTIDRCENITVSSVCIERDIDIYLGFHPNTSDSIFSQRSTENYDDLFTFQLCPDPGQRNKTMYFYMLGDSWTRTTINFLVTTSARILAQDISQLPVTSGSWELSGATTLHFGNESMYCENFSYYCKEYFPTHPRYAINPLYPVPPGFMDGGFGRLRMINVNDTSPSKPNCFQFGVIITTLVNGLHVEFLDLDTIKRDGIYIEFLGRLIDRDGIALALPPITLPLVEPPCHYKDFLQVDSELDLVLANLTDSGNFLDLMNLRYKYDMLTFRDDYHSCRSMALSMIDFDTSEIKLVNETRCSITVKSTSTAPTNDPCCDYTSTFDNVCMPSMVNETITKFTDIRSDRVGSMCSIPVCSESVLTNYALSNIIDINSPCAVASSEQYNLIDSFYNAYRYCHDHITKPPKCRQDKDCTSLPGYINGRCSLILGQCIAHHQDIEMAFAQCIIDNVPSAITSELATLLNTTEFTAQWLFNHFQFEDCVTINNIDLSTRYTMIYRTGGPPQMPQCSGMNAIGLDRSANLKYYDNCQNGVSTWTWAPYTYAPNSCKENKLFRCNWLGMEGLFHEGIFSPTEPQDIIDKCANSSAPNMFCGQCDEDTTVPCYSDLSLKQSDCDGRFVCQSPLGVGVTNYHNTLNQSECSEKYGTCNQQCGQQCGGPSCTVMVTLGTPCPANTVNKTTIANTTYCYLVATETDCKKLPNSTYFSCQSLSADQCLSCNSSAYSPLCQCTTTNVVCQNQTQCEAAQGMCSDIDFFADISISQPRCVFGYGDPYSLGSLPRCSYNQVDTPYGCMSFNTVYFNRTICEINQGTWRTPAKNKKECESHWGCRGIDRSASFVLPMTYRFNPKSESECRLAGEEWVQAFTWTPSQWQPAQAVPMRWMPALKEVWQTPILSISLDFSTMFDMFESAMQTRISVLFKSEVLCRTSNLKASLKASACACAATDQDQGGSACFKETTPPLSSIIKPCSGEAHNYDLLSDQQTGSISFTNTSIRSHTCVSIGMGIIHAEEYRAKRIVALSSNFISYVRPADYSLFNEDRAVAGQMITDGVSLQIFDKGVNSFTLCLPKTMTYPNHFTVIDFAKIPQSDTPLGYSHQGVVTPLNCHVTVNTTTGHYCCLIQQNKSIGIEGYLLIARVEKWHDQRYRPFPKSSERLIYTLASLFLIMSIFVRSTYFFILPGGVLAAGYSNVLDYILVVLPTFLYFTSFSIVVILWYIISRTNISLVTNIFKMINSLIVATNVVLYVLFIIIVLIFNFTMLIPETCGGRIPGVYTNSQSQRIVSILYAVVQAFLSLIIGIGFIYYGNKRDV
eukprot:gene14807-17506_t